MNNEVNFPKLLEEAKQRLAQLEAMPRNAQIEKGVEICNNAIDFYEAKVLKWRTKK